MQEDLFKMIGILLFIGIIIYLAVKSMRLQTSIIEGLTNSDTTTSTATSSNVGSGAANYSAKINTEFLRMKDLLNIEKYRTDYENVIIQLDDYVSSLMLQQILSLDTNNLSQDTVTPILDKINTMNTGKQSLNSIMKFIDGIH